MYMEEDTVSKTCLMGTTRNTFAHSQIATVYVLCRVARGHGERSQLP